MTFCTGLGGAIVPCCFSGAWLAADTEVDTSWGIMRLFWAMSHTFSAEDSSTLAAVYGCALCVLSSSRHEETARCDELAIKRPLMGCQS